MHGVLTLSSRAQLTWRVVASRNCVKIVLAYEGISKAAMTEVRREANTKQYTHTERAYTNSDGKIHLVMREITTKPLEEAILETLIQVMGGIKLFTLEEKNQVHNNQKRRQSYRRTSQATHRHPRRRRNKRDRRTERLMTTRAASLLSV